MCRLAQLADTYLTAETLAAFSVMHGNMAVFVRECEQVSASVFLREFAGEDWCIRRVLGLPHDFFVVVVPGASESAQCTVAAPPLS